MAIDTKSLLHFNGVDGSPEIFDECGKTWTPTNVVIDDAQFVFNESALFPNPANTASITTDASSDFDPGSGDFTMDFRIRWASLIVDTASIPMIDSDDFPANGYFYLEMDTTIGGECLSFRFLDSGGIAHQMYYSQVFSVNTWYHIALVRYGNDLTFYVDGIGGVPVDVTGITIKPTLAPIYITGSSDSGNVWMDEFRFAKVAKWTTATFVLPVAEYALEASDFIDECGHLFHGWNSASLDTTEKVFGDASLLLVNANQEAIRTPVSADFDLGANTVSFCVDFWVWFDILPTAGLNRTLVAQHNSTDGLENWRMYLQNTAGTYSLRFVARDNAGNPLVTVNKNLSLAPTLNTWYHIAFTAEAVAGPTRTFRWFLNGTQVSTDVSDTDTIYAPDGDFWIGGYGDESWRGLDGQIDEFRLSVGDYRWNSDFAVPVAEYSVDASTKLLLHLDTGIIPPSPGPTMAERMRLAKWFSGGVFQDYYL